MSGFATMARQAAEMEASLNRPSAGTSTQTTTSGVSPAARRNVSSLFATAKKLYAPGGEFMAGIEASISRGSKRAVASGVQQLASAGLAGTSMVGGLGKKYEEEIGTPARAQATTARLGALAGLLQAEAGAELQMASRYGQQASQQPAPSMAASYAPQRPAARQTAQPAKLQPLPTLNLPGMKRDLGRAPGGRTATVYNPYTYTGSAAKPLSSFYGGGSLMQQADPYDISGRYF